MPTPTHDPKTEDSSVMRLPRVAVDFKIPLWGVVGAAATAGALLLNMWVTLSSVAEKTTQMQATLAHVVDANTKLISDQALLQYRIEKLEASDRRAK